MLAADGSLDRPALAAVVFADPEARARLDGIVHPLVRARAAELAAAAPPDAVVVHDVPLLVETGQAASYDLVLVVEADPETRVARLVQRGLTAEDARARIAVQATDEQRRAVADVVLDNSGTPEQLGGPGGPVLGRAGRARAVRLDPRERQKSPRSVDLGLVLGGRYWDRTSDLFRVREARYRCANRPSPAGWPDPPPRSCSARRRGGDGI